MKKWIRIGAVSLAVLTVSLFMIHHPAVRRTARLVRHALGLGPGANVYVAQVAAGANDGSSCANAKNVTYFNTAGNWSATPSGIQIGPDVNVHLCGTFTGTANSTMLTAQGSGSSGHPVTIIAEPGLNMTAPYWGSSSGGSSQGAITLGAQTFIIVDGNNLQGTIQNSANGSRLANSQASTGISSFGANNTIKGWTILNMYVNVAPDFVISDNNVIRAIDFNGSNNLVTGNKIDACGWCIFDSFKNGDTGNEISFNEVSHFGHGVMWATAGANGSTQTKVHDNNLHDTSNWDTTTIPGGTCHYHQDGLHTFGTTGSSIDQFAFYNNWIHGSWGFCPTGFVFVEGGASTTPSHMLNSQWYNNVMIVENQLVVNTNGWFNISSGDSGVQEVYANTVKGTNATDNTLGLTVQNASSLNFRDNVIDNVGDPLNFKSDTLSTVGTNYYGNSCHNTGNCFILNGSFTGSFSAWKTACSCDSTSFQNDVLLLNADGSPTASSPVLGVGANLTSLASGNLAALTTSTTKGNTITGVARPGGSTLWTDGAYQAVSSAPVIQFSPDPVAFGSQTQFTTSSPITVTVSNTGTANEALANPFFTITGTNAGDFARTGGSLVNSGNIAAGGGGTIILTCTPSTVGLESAVLNIKGTVNASVNLSCTGTAPAVPAVTLSPVAGSTIAFGSQNVGTQSGNHAVTLTNSGTATLNITSIVSSDATQFPLNTNTCGVTLAPSASCGLNVKFAPTSVGAKTGTLTFTTNASTSPDVINLTGTGAVPPPSPTPAPATTIMTALPAGSVTIASISPAETQVTAKGCSSDGVTYQNPCRFLISCGNCSQKTAVRVNGVTVAQSYNHGVITAIVPLSALPMATVATPVTFSLSN